MGVRIANNFTGAGETSPPVFNFDPDHFRARLLQDALTEATATYWERRADAFENAAPQPDDHRGHATPDELVDQAIRSRQTAENCRHHAQLLREQPPEYATEIRDALS